MKKKTYEDINRAFKALEEREEMLDLIREEISHNLCKDVNIYSCGKNYGLLIAIQIIDNYKAEMEEHNV